MQKTFVNALAYSRLLKLLMISVLVFVGVVDLSITYIIIKLIPYAAPEEKIRITQMLVVMLVASASGVPLFYFVHRSMKAQWLRIDQNGIEYYTWTKKISVSWNEIKDIFIVPRGRNITALRIKTPEGNFYISPMFVDKSKPIPQVKLRLSGLKLVYPPDELRSLDIQKNEVFAEVRNYLPDLVEAAVQRSRDGS